MNEEVEFKNSSWHKRFHDRVYGYRAKAPVNFCPYVRKLLWGFVTLPTTWLGVLVAKDDDLGSKFAVTMIPTALYVMLTRMGWEYVAVHSEQCAFVANNQHWMAYLLIPLLFVVLIVLMLTIVMLVIFGLFTLCKFIGNKVSEREDRNGIVQTCKEDRNGIVQTYKEAKKSKTCPAIKWVD